MNIKNTKDKSIMYAMLNRNIDCVLGYPLDDKNIYFFVNFNIFFDKLVFDNCYF